MSKTNNFVQGHILSTVGDALKAGQREPTTGITGATMKDGWCVDKKHRSVVSPNALPIANHGG
jgi:hypothetical protein